MKLTYWNELKTSRETKCKREFLSLDPLAGDFPSLSPYNYVACNPIKLVDPDGRAPAYPTPLLTFNPTLGLYGGYQFTRSATHLLSLVSGVDKLMISRAVIQERAPGQYRPFYSSYEGGGAITLGTSGYNASITYTANWFEDDASKYGGHGYGQNIYKWLDLSAHEVGHLSQIEKEEGFFGYIGEFMKQYFSSGNHDGAPYEIDAEKGSQNFRKFNSFINEKYGQDALIKMLGVTPEQDKLRGTEQYKINKIDKFWDEYNKSFE